MQRQDRWPQEKDATFSPGQSAAEGQRETYRDRNKGHQGVFLDEHARQGGRHE